MKARLIGIAGAILALLCAALATGTRIYYFLLLIILLMLLVSVASALWTLLTLDMKLKGIRTKVIRGEKLPVILTASHRSLLPSGQISFVMSLPGSVSTREINAVISPFTQQSFRSSIECMHRGSYEVGVERVRVADPFGLISLSKQLKDMMWKIDVYPKDYPETALEPKTSESAGEYRMRTPDDNASPSDVRKWQDGDTYKKVHWKLSVKKMDIMVRSFEESARPDTLVVPDLTEIKSLADQRLALEDRICEAAFSVAKAQLEAGYPVCMTLEGTHPREVSGTSIIELPSFGDALMRAVFDSPYSYEQLLVQLQRRAQRTGGIVMITSKLSPRVADIAIRMKAAGMAVRLIYVTDAPRSEALEMMERIRMSGVQAERSDPWSEGGSNPEERDI